MKMVLGEAVVQPTPTPVTLSLPGDYEIQVAAHLTLVQLQSFGQDVVHCLRSLDQSNEDDAERWPRAALIWLHLAHVQNVLYPAIFYYGLFYVLKYLLFVSISIYTHIYNIYLIEIWNIYLGNLFLIALYPPVLFVDNFCFNRGLLTFSESTTLHSKSWKWKSSSLTKTYIYFLTIFLKKKKYTNESYELNKRYVAKHDSLNISMTFQDPSLTIFY